MSNIKEYKEQLKELLSEYTIIDKFKINEDGTFSYSIQCGSDEVFSLKGKLIDEGVIIHTSSAGITNFVGLERAEYVASEDLLIRNIDGVNIRAYKVLRTNYYKKDNEAINNNHKLIENLYNNYEDLVNDVIYASNLDEVKEKYSLDSISKEEKIRTKKLI